MKKSYQAILFDLDGTLLPLDQDKFVKDYFYRLAKKLAPLGYESELLFKTIWAGMAEMVKNDGSRTNERAFWEVMVKVFGESTIEHIPTFDEYYRTDFQNVKNSCGFNPASKRVIEKIKDSGTPIILATNPVFPAIATYSRVRWAGLEPSDFKLITTYENSSFCKPNTAYYLDILSKFDLCAENCLMVGNDVEEDMIASTLGMDVFLLDDCLINKYGKDISIYPRGNFDKLEEYLGI